jgi:SAM-dependent methyltransferase
MEIRDHATEFMNDAQAMALEDTIWWAVGRRSILRPFLDRARDHQIQKILEVGCGSGGDLSLLARYAKVWGVERSGILAGRARARNVAESVFESDFFDQEIDDQFDLFCLFDVLEHIEHDDRFIQRLAGRAGGAHMVLISVPACQFLFGPHDERLHHFRRYSRKGLERLLHRNGYEVLAINYFLFFLFPLALIARLHENLKSRFGFQPKEVNIGRVPAVINWLFIRVLRLEAFLGRFLSFPFGLWVVALARRQER